MLAAAVGVTLLIGHESIGLFWLVAYGIPSFAAAFVAGIVAGRRLADGPRRVGLAAALLLVSGISAGITSWSSPGAGRQVPKSDCWRPRRRRRPRRPCRMSSPLQSNL